MPPKFMLCSRGMWNTAPPAGWIIEPKYDGTRIMAQKRGSEIKLTNRRDLPKERVFPEVVEDLSSIEHDFVLDGEVVCEKGFTYLLSREHCRDTTKVALLKQLFPVKYYVFDILELDGVDLRALPLRERKIFLGEIVKGGSHVQTVSSISFAEAVDMVVQGKIEGFVAKDPASKYVGDRSSMWRKYRKMETSDLPVLGLLKSDKEGRPIKSLLVVKDGRPVKCAGELSLRDMEVIRDVFEAHGVLAKTPMGEAVLLSRPVLWAEVEYFSNPETPYRFPLFKRFRTDVGGEGV